MKPQKSPFYKTMDLRKNAKGKLIGLFEIFKTSNCKEHNGYSVKIKTRGISFKNFKKGFFEYFNLEDKKYGITAWDFTNKENAIKKFMLF